MKVAAAPGQVCSGMRIQAIDMFQPPGISMSPMADMEAHQTIVPAVLRMKSNAEMAKKVRSEAARPLKEPVISLIVSRTRRADATTPEHTRAHPRSCPRGRDRETDRSPSSPRRH